MGTSIEVLAAPPPKVGGRPDRYTNPTLRRRPRNDLDIPDGQLISRLPNARLTQNSAAVTVGNLDYNGALPRGASTTFGFVASWTGANRAPSDVACQAR